MKPIRFHFLFFGLAWLGGALANSVAAGSTQSPSDAWFARTNGTPPAGSYGPAVWTGSEMIVWSGYYSYNGIGSYLNDTWSYFPNGPRLRMFLPATNSAVLAWPVWSIPFTLRQKSVLGSNNWTTVTNPVSVVGSEYQVNVSPPAGSRFFQLLHP